jgi:hypothetical protein
VGQNNFHGGVKNGSLGKGREEGRAIEACADSVAGKAFNTVEKNQFSWDQVSQEEVTGKEMVEGRAEVMQCMFSKVTLKILYSVLGTMGS